MRLVPGWLPCLFVGLTAGGLLQGCDASKAETESAPAVVLTVEVVTPVRERWPDRLGASGEIAAWQEAVIGAEVSGLRLKDVLADVGDMVKKGQVLARYDDESLRADLARLAAEVAEAEANLQEAQADVARADRLQGSQAISGQAAEAFRTRAQVAQARLESARARRAVQAVQLRHTHITAPDDGVITARSATLGAVGMVGTELFRLLRGGRLEWRAEVPSGRLAQIEPGMVVEIHGLDGTAIAGVVRQRAPTVDPRTRNGIVYVDIPSQSGLSAGMYVTGDFVLQTREALSVPESAIVMRDGNRYLMRVDASGLVQPVKVRSGRRRNDAIEIIDGIAADERYVRLGGAFLSEGDRVAVSPDQPSS